MQFYGYEKKRIVKYHQSAFARHIYIADNNSPYGADYNKASLSLMLSWIEGINSQRDRSFQPLSLIEKKTNEILGKWMDNISNLTVSFIKAQSCFKLIPKKDDNKFVTESKHTPQAAPNVKPYKRQGFHIQDTSDSKFIPRVVFTKVINTMYSIRLSKLPRNIK